jgi:hypothetical protein
MTRKDLQINFRSKTYRYDLYWLGYRLDRYRNANRRNVERSQFETILFLREAFPANGSSYSKRWSTARFPTPNRGSLCLWRRIEGPSCLAMKPGCGSHSGSDIRPIPGETRDWL